MMESCSRPQKYCGLISLRNGIYFKSFFNVIVAMILLRKLVVVIIDLINEEHFLFWDSEETNENIYRNITERELKTIINLKTALVTFILFWITFKMCYVLIIFGTVWAIYKQKTKMLQIFVYVNIPNWIFDVLLTIMAGKAVDISYKLLMNIIVLTEVYNLLAIRSEYKRMTGKAALFDRDSETITYPNGFTSPPHRDLRFSTISTDIHCRTCTCNLTPILEGPVTFQPQLRTVNENLTQDDPPSPDKELNFKEQPIIYNQNQLIERQSSVIDYDIDFNQPHSSSYYASPALNGDEKKVDISDVPVIYDENQLNVGTSPVIEDRKGVRNK